MTDCHDPADTLVGDRVIIEDLRIPAYIGVYTHEKGRTQTVSLCLEIGLPSQVCFRSDAVEHTIDYGAVAGSLRALAVSRHFNLIEFFAEQVSRVVLEQFGALWVKVRIRKIRVVPGAEYVGVAITRLNKRVSGERAAGFEGARVAGAHGVVATIASE